MVEGACDLSARDQAESFHTLEVSMLDSHDTLLRQEVLGVVIYELSVDEAVDAVCRDRVNLGFHFFLQVALVNH